MTYAEVERLYAQLGGAIAARNLDECKSGVCRLFGAIEAIRHDQAARTISPLVTFARPAEGVQTCE